MLWPRLLRIARTLQLVIGSTLALATWAAADQSQPPPAEAAPPACARIPDREAVPRVGDFPEAATALADAAPVLGVSASDDIVDSAEPDSGLREP
jgi:hypothetical protein